MRIKLFPRGARVYLKLSADWRGVEFTNDIGAGGEIVIGTQCD
jgi:hypothetical protein